MARPGLLSFFLDQLRPSGSGSGEVVFLVLIESITHAQAVLHQQMTVDDLKRIHLNRGEMPFGNPESAVAAKSRFVFAGIRVEQRFVFRRGKAINSVVISALEISRSFDRLAIGKKTNGIIALQRNTSFIRVDQCFVIREDWQRQNRNR